MKVVNDSYKKYNVKIDDNTTLTIFKKGVNCHYGIKDTINDTTYTNFGFPGTGFYLHSNDKQSYNSHTRFNAELNIWNNRQKKYLPLLIFLTLCLMCLTILFLSGFYFLVYFVFCLVLVFVISIYLYYSYKPEPQLAFIKKAEEIKQRLTDITEINILDSWIKCCISSNKIDEYEGIIQALDVKIRRKNNEKYITLKDKYLKLIEKEKEHYESVRFNADNELTQNQIKLYSLFYNQTNLYKRSSIKYCKKSFFKKNYYEYNRLKRKLAVHNAKFSAGTFNFIKSMYDIPVISLLTTDYYLYPSFIIVAKSPWNFKVINKPLHEYIEIYKYIKQNKNDNVLAITLPLDGIGKYVFFFKDALIEDIIQKCEDVNSTEAPIGNESY